MQPEVIDHKCIGEMEKEIIIGNDLSDIPYITHFIQEVGTSLQMSPEEIMSIDLALEEAVVNVIRYAYPEGGEHRIRLKIDIARHELIFQIIDDGMAFDLTLPDENDVASHRGQLFIDRLGVCLIYKIMDEVTYQSENGKNRLTMKKRLGLEFKNEKTMKTNMCKIEGITIVTLEGRLDTVNARDFELMIQPLMEDDKPEIIINCENFSYISSSGIRSLILLQKSVMKNNGCLVLEAMKPEIRKIFDMTGCSSLFTIR